MTLCSRVVPKAHAPPKTAAYRGAHMLSWLATFCAVVIGSASILVVTWAIWLIVDPAEQIHFEYAIPGLLLAGVGAATAVVLWRRGT